MQFRGKEYYTASLERIRQARTISVDGKAYSLAIYCGGLAVECMFRAFRSRIDPSFDSRHDLNQLLKSSGILRVDEEHMRQRNKSDIEIQNSAREFRAAVNEVAIIWHNNLRFASEGRLKVYLNSIDRVQGIKGDPLKKNALDFLNSAQTIIDRGIALWVP